MKLWVVVLLLFVSAESGFSSAQHTAPSQSETPVARARRQDALRLARQINIAENASRQFGGRYVPYEKLANVSPVPAGFTVHLVTDGRTYLFALKDSTSGDEYAIVSDETGTIYEAYATRGGGIVPVHTFLIAPSREPHQSGQS